MVTTRQLVLNVWEQATTVRWEQAMQELDQRLCSLPALWGKTLLTCSPTDVISFMERSWLAKHGGTVLPDGTTVASPSVRKCVPIQPVHRPLPVGKNRQLEPSHSSGQSHTISWAQRVPSAILAQRLPGIISCA